MADVGKVDADYIRKVVRWVRYTGFGGRALLMVGAIGGAFVPWLLWPACIVGVLLLALEGGLQLRRPQGVVATAG